MLAIILTFLNIALKYFFCWLLLKFGTQAEYLTYPTLVPALKVADIFQHFMLRSGGLCDG